MFMVVPLSLWYGRNVSDLSIIKEWAVLNYILNHWKYHSRQVDGIHYSQCILWARIRMILLDHPFISCYSRLRCLTWLRQGRMWGAIWFITNIILTSIIIGIRIQLFRIRSVFEKSNTKRSHFELHSTA